MRILMLLLLIGIMISCEPEAITAEEIELEHNCYNRLLSILDTLSTVQHFKVSLVSSVVIVLLNLAKPLNLQMLFIQLMRVSMP